MKTEATLNSFNNYGYLLVQTPDSILKVLNSKANEIKQNFTKATPYNNNLAGNLQYEFLLDDIPELNTFIINSIIAYDSYFEYTSSIAVLSNNLPFVVDTPWINFMKKNEFNPPHCHKGVYSYVIWLDIPYDIEDEKRTPSSIKSNANTPGHFGFLYTSTLGDIKTTILPVDKKWNGTLCLFPSKLFHFVNPFTTSDEYRITVAGNIMLDVGKNK